MLLHFHFGRCDWPVQTELNPFKIVIIVRDFAVRILRISQIFLCFSQKIRDLRRGFDVILRVKIVRLWGSRHHLVRKLLRAHLA